MDTIVLPLESETPAIESYAHYIFRHRLDGLGTFIGEVLLSMGLFEQEYIYKSNDKVRIHPRLFLNDAREEQRQQVIALREKHGRTDEIMQQTSWFHEDPVPSPEIVWCPRKERQNLCGDLLKGLFHTALTQLVSVYEILIGDTARAILNGHNELLGVDERQLTSKEIVELQNYERVIDDLIERAVSKFTHNVAYPDLVTRFHSKFHIGIHDMNSPVQLFPVHHLIEKRNIIVHNDGITSSKYIEKMRGYNTPEILAEDEELPIDFMSFYNDLLMIRQLGTYIETCTQGRWPDLPYITVATTAA